MTQCFYDIGKMISVMLKVRLSVNNKLTESDILIETLSLWKQLT